MKIEITEGPGFWQWATDLANGNLLVVVVAPETDEAKMFARLKRVALKEGKK